MERQPPDILHSIGSSCTPRSKHDRESRSTDTRVYKIALKHFDNMMDAHNAWDQFEQEVREPYEPQNGQYIRLNPEMKSKVKLDDVSGMGELRKRVDQEFLKTDEQEKSLHKVMAKMEIGLIRRLVEFQHD